MAVIAGTLLASPASGGGYPTSRAARAWTPPTWWLPGALCVHRHESVDWHRRWITWDGRHSPYAGGMQMLESTWVGAGGRGEPWAWSRREQLFRAWRIWRRDGGSWREWGTAAICGLQ